MHGLALHRSIAVENKGVQKLFILAYIGGVRHPFVDA